MKKTKRGRKAKPYFFNGEYINGLRQRPSDGRWELSDGRTFVEPNPARAVDRFRQMTGAKPTIEQLKRLGFRWDATDPDQMAIYGPAGLAAAIAINQNAYKAAMQWFAGEIRKRPQKVAEASGVEQLGYLTGLRPPEKLPTLDEVSTIFRAASRTSTPEKNKIVAAWTDFCITTGIEGINDISGEVCVEFRRKVHARGIAGKTQLHLFNRIRRILKVVKNDAIASEAITRALANLQTLTASEVSTSLNPEPIEVSDFKALLGAATGDNRAMILLALNCCMYLQEVVRVRWSDIRNGALIGHRAKKGKVVRVAMLWPETIEALAAVKRRGDYIFYSETGLPLTISGASKRYRKLRTAAGVSDKVKAEQFRDGALTAASDAGVPENVCRVYEGHRADGVKDHYVKRNPKFVRPATDAVYKHYFG